MRKLPAALIAVLLAMVSNGVSYSADSDNSTQSAQDNTRHNQPGPATVTDPLEPIKTASPNTHRSSSVRPARKMDCTGTPQMAMSRVPWGAK